jgi:hypothetical protein
MTTTAGNAVRDAVDGRRRTRDQRGIAPTAARTDRLPPAPRERRPMLAALAVLLIVGGAAAAGLLALRADERVEVLVAARDIPAGSTITAEDMTTVPVAAEGTRLVPASQRGLVDGRYARTSISAGQLIDTTMLAETAPLQPGLVAVGASLAAGRMPASGLESGDVVQLVRVSDGEGRVLVDDARVGGYRETEGGGLGSSAATVSFIVPDTDGASVAAVAAAGELAVVLVERGTPMED